MSNSLLRKINILALCAYIYTPIYLYNKHINVIIVILSFLVWLISSYKIEANWLSRFKQYLPTLFMMILLNVLYCFSIGTDVYPIMVMSILAYTGIMVYTFYCNHLDLLKWPFIFIIVILCFDCVDTIQGNILVPGISRKQGVGYGAQEASEFLYTMHIGSYPFLYSISLMILPITLLYRQKLIPIIIYIPIIILFIITILYGSYFISLAIAIIMIILGFINIKSLKKAVILCITAIVMYMVFKEPILNSVIALGETTNSTIIIQHAQEILSGNSEGDVDQVTGGRATLYTNAFYNFLDHPLIGQLSGEKAQRFSMHSELLEYLEKFGLLAFPFFYIWIQQYKTQHKSLKTNIVKTYHTIFFATFIFFLFINPLRNEQPLTMTLYCIIPLILLYIDRRLVLPDCYSSTSQ